MLGLAGEVGKQPFQELLQGQLPDGSLVNQVEGRRMGLDLTFSMPKSASVLALVGGDSRLLEEHRQAVRETMQWVEKTHAEVRSYERSRNGEPVRSGNLVWAMFEHDTSRKLDPQSHIHVVVAAISQAANGDWRALFNGAIWSANATIGSVYHAQFREKVEALGYGTELSGKHGQFEISDVPRVSRAFSQRREEILERVAALGIATPQGQDAVVLGTRDNKTNVEDKGALYQAWQERAAALGFDAKAMVEQAAARAGLMSRSASLCRILPWPRGSSSGSVRRSACGFVPPIRSPPTACGADAQPSRNPQRNGRGLRHPHSGAAGGRLWSAGDHQDRARSGACQCHHPARGEPGAPIAQTWAVDPRQERKARWCGDAGDHAGAFAAGAPVAGRHRCWA
jgi:conjugative relaxase-like TrwC/TraI family protein